MSVFTQFLCMEEQLRILKGDLKFILFKNYRLYKSRIIFVVGAKYIFVKSMNEWINAIATHGILGSILKSWYIAICPCYTLKNFKKE